MLAAQHQTGKAAPGAGPSNAAPHLNIQNR